MTAIVGLLLILVVGPPVVSWYFSTRRRCPDCHRHALAWIDQSVFYDPRPKRTLHRCSRCRAEFVRTGGKWVTREEWDRQQGGDIWLNVR
jgi:hypothetical protein